MDMDVHRNRGRDCSHFCLAAQAEAPRPTGSNCLRPVRAANAAGRQFLTASHSKPVTERAWATGRAAPVAVRARRCVTERDDDTDANPDRNRQADQRVKDERQDNAPAENKREAPHLASID